MLSDYQSEQDIQTNINLIRSFRYTLLINVFLCTQANMSFGVCPEPEADVIPTAAPPNTNFGYSNRGPVQIQWLFGSLLVTLLLLLSL